LAPAGFPPFGPQLDDCPLDDFGLSPQESRLLAPFTRTSTVRLESVWENWQRVRRCLFPEEMTITPPSKERPAPSPGRRTGRPLPTSRGPQGRVPRTRCRRGTRAVAWADLSDLPLGPHWPVGAPGARPRKGGLAAGRRKEDRPGQIKKASPPPFGGRLAFSEEHREVRNGRWACR
jgi:hypothetical protein